MNRPTQQRHQTHAHPNVMLGVRIEDVLPEHVLLRYLCDSGIVDNDAEIDTEVALRVATKIAACKSLASSNGDDATIGGSEGFRDDDADVGQEEEECFDLLDLANELADFEEFDDDQLSAEPGEDTEEETTMTSEIEPSTAGPTAHDEAESIPEQQPEATLEQDVPPEPESDSAEASSESSDDADVGGLLADIATEPVTEEESSVAEPAAEVAESVAQPGDRPSDEVATATEDEAELGSLMADSANEVPKADGADEPQEPPEALVEPVAATEAATEVEAEPEVATEAPAELQAAPARQLKEEPAAAQPAEAPEEFALTNGTIDKVQDFLSELKGALVEMAQRPPEATQAAAMPPAAIDVEPLIQAMQAGFERSAQQAEQAHIAVASLGEHMTQLGSQLEGGVSKTVSSILKQQQSMAAPAAAVPTPKFVEEGGASQTVVLGAVALVVLGWSILFWIKTGSPRLALGTLIGANLIACCMLLSRRSRS